jgi:hypothetical protein
MYHFNSQANYDKLSSLCDAVVSETCVRSNISEAMVCVLPPNVQTAEVFCHFIYNITSVADVSVCTMIIEADVISTMFDCLRRWLQDEKVVACCCAALLHLAFCQHEHVKQALRDVPNCEHLLRAAQATGFKTIVCDDGTCAPVAILRELGM